MKKTFILVIFLTAFFVLLGYFIIGSFTKRTKLEVKNQMLKLSSTAFENNENIPLKYTCQGENINPPLKIEQVPPEAKSLALIVDDPDAPMGDFTHWLVWNLRPQIKEIAENSTPEEAVVGQNDAHQNTYTGPCPPSGTHHYFFRLFALDDTLNLPANTDRQRLEESIKSHALDKAELVGQFAKN